METFFWQVKQEALSPSRRMWALKEIVIGSFLIRFVGVAADLLILDQFVIGSTEHAEVRYVFLDQPCIPQSLSSGPMRSNLLDGLHRGFLRHWEMLPLLVVACW